MSKTRILDRRDVRPSVVSRCCSAAVRLSPAVLVAVLASACGHGAGDRLQGKWVGDRIDNVSAEQVVAATAWVKATTLEFAGDRLTVTIPSQEARKGTFKVDRVEGDQIVLSMPRKGAGREETTLTLADHKTLRWDIGQNREVTLVRAQ